MQTDLNAIICRALKKDGGGKPHPKAKVPPGHGLKIALLLLPEIALEKKEKHEKGKKNGQQ